MAWGERNGDKRQDLTEAFIRREILRETKGWLINIPVPIVFSLILLAFLSIGSLAAKLGIGLVASVCAFFRDMDVRVRVAETVLVKARSLLSDHRSHLQHGIYISWTRIL